VAPVLSNSPFKQSFQEEQAYADEFIRIVDVIQRLGSECAKETYGKREIQVQVLFWAPIRLAIGGGSSPLLGTTVFFMTTQSTSFLIHLAID
jgi:hypothetical protein